MLSKTIRRLCEFQFKGADGMDFSYCYPASEFNARSIFWDLNYFKYCFLKATGLEFNEGQLEDDFQHLADVLLRSSSATFMYRDFQSRNVMIKDGEPMFIDFQGGRKGPFFYDVASFLWQAKANFPNSLRQELLKAPQGGTQAAANNPFPPQAPAAGTAPIPPAQLRLLLMLLH